MALFERHNYAPYPDSPFGVWQREQGEYDLLKLRALALANGKFLLKRTLTPEDEAVIKEAYKTDPPKPFTPIKMWPGWRHKRMYGTWSHHFVGTGASALWRRTCVCGKVVLR